MPEVYNMAGTLLFFTKAEGHPLVPLEAIACGLDVIASKESNIEIIPPERDGFYRIDGRKARRLILKYDWRIQAKKYEDVYNSIVNR